MHLLNFAHPLTDEQRQRTEQLLGEPLKKILQVHVQIETQKPLAPQVQRLLEQIDFTPVQWQSLPILINPPSLNFVAAVLLAELHGRMGYFAPIIRLRPVQGAVPPRFEVAEIINLQALREQARQKRQHGT